MVRDGMSPEHVRAALANTKPDRIQYLQLVGASDSAPTVIERYVYSLDFARDFHLNVLYSNRLCTMWSHTASTLEVREPFRTKAPTSCSGSRSLSSNRREPCWTSVLTLTLASLLVNASCASPDVLDTDLTQCAAALRPVSQNDASRIVETDSTVSPYAEAVTWRTIGALRELLDDYRVSTPLLLSAGTCRTRHTVGLFGRSTANSGLGERWLGHPDRL